MGVSSKNNQVVLYLQPRTYVYEANKQKSALTHKCIGLDTHCLHEHLSQCTHLERQTQAQNQPPQMQNSTTSKDSKTAKF